MKTALSAPFGPGLLASALFAALALTACETEPMGPVAPAPVGYAPPPEQPGQPGQFRPQDFAWSSARGSASIQGLMAYRQDGVRYACDGGDVLLTPETPWSRRRMIILYGSASAAAVPVSIVRARTPSAPSGDYARYVRRTTCDADNHFSFPALPPGAWYVITVARPPANAPGEPMAVSRRVETRGGDRFVTLN